MQHAWSPPRTYSALSKKLEVMPRAADFIGTIKEQNIFLQGIKPTAKAFTRTFWEDFSSPTCGGQ